MNIIVAADENWAIGHNGSMLVNIPADQKMFRNETAGKVVVTGRKTLETYPQGQPLGGRVNIILSRDKNYKVSNAIVAHSKEELMDILKNYDSEDIYIAGGASIFEMMLPECDTVHVTKIDHSYVADKFFMNLDKSDDWEIVADSDEQVYFDLTYCFLKYQRKQ